MQGTIIAQPFGFSNGSIFNIHIVYLKDFPNTIWRILTYSNDTGNIVLENLYAKGEYYIAKVEDVYYLAISTNDPECTIKYGVESVVGDEKIVPLIEEYNHWNGVIQSQLIGTSIEFEVVDHHNPPIALIPDLIKNTMLYRKLNPDTHIPFNKTIANTYYDELKNKL